jgi:hypothetical protein
VTLIAVDCSAGYDDAHGFAIGSGEQGCDDSTAVLDHPRSNGFFNDTTAEASILRRFLDGIP